VLNPLPYPLRPCFSLRVRTKKGIIRQDEDGRRPHPTPFDARSDLRKLRRQPRFQSPLSHVAVRRGHYAALKFWCRRCGGRRYRLQIVADSLGEQEPLKMQHFRGPMKNSATRSGRPSQSWQGCPGALSSIKARRCPPKHPVPLPPARARCRARSRPHLSASGLRS
jgi:hypothetical protein